LLILMILSLLVGLCLARYNVLAVLIAIAVVAAGAVILDVAQDAPLTHSLLAGAMTAIFLPVGYLVGQLLRPSRK
jgi:hypothetical protein